MGGLFFDQGGLKSEQFFWELSKNLKPATKDYGYGPLGNALLQQLSEPTDNRTRSYTGETAKAGWGSSIWDKHNWYYPGMNLEESRRIARQTFWIKIAKTSGIIAICALLIAIAISLYKK